jgi:hypothetical protein
MVVTEVLVPGRAHAVYPDGELGLSDSSVARVQTAVAYYHNNEDVFAEQGGRILFEGGWAEAATGMSKPPEGQREGRLMYDLAADLGVPEQFRVAGIESRTTMENCLNARQVFSGVGQLAIVTQLSQAARLIYCAGRALPERYVYIIEAPGEDNPKILEDEERLFAQSRILYGWAYSPRTLRIADRIGVLAGRLSGVRPGREYNIKKD